MFFLQSESRVFSFPVTWKLSGCHADIFMNRITIKRSCFKGFIAFFFKLRYKNVDSSVISEG